MDILFACHDGVSGCGHWRAAIPAKHLRRRGHNATLLEAGSRRPDVIVFGRAYNFEAENYMHMFRLCKAEGVPAIYDLDDAFALLDPANPATRAVRAHQSEFEFMLRNADVVTTTTSTLAEHLRAWNPNVVVIPNCVDPEDWTVHPRSHEGIRIGWTGGSTHFGDLTLIADALASLKKIRPFTLVINGLVQHPSVEDFYRQAAKKAGRAFTESLYGRAIHTFLRKTNGLPYEFHPFGPVNEYSSKICSLSLDIGVAPLARTDFNRHKSSIKYYEYAMSGAATVASDVLPYSDETPMLAENTRKAWVARLSELMDSDFRAVAAAQREWVLANRNIEHTVDLWEQVLCGSIRTPQSMHLPATPVQDALRC
jgi:glycosyltransferase involved in cell wall biosynthesis